MSTLVIGSHEFPTETLLEFDQDYQDLNAASFRRTADGSAVIRELWTGKLRTTISGRGWAPGPIRLLQENTSYLIKCVMPIPVESATTTVTIPAGRRTDSEHQPVGFAIVNGLMIETPITNIAAINAESTNDATLTAVSGSSGYRVQYAPEFTGAIRTLRVVGKSTASYDVEIEAEEL